MSSPGLSTEIQAFITSYIESLAQLEALACLQQNPGKKWSAEALSQELRSNPDAAAGQLTSLRAKGLLSQCGSEPPLFRYDPRSPELDAVVRELVELYVQRLISISTLVGLIYDKPSDKVRAFANAFRLKGE